MHVERDTNRWAQQTFGECELGDERRTHRLVDLASRLSSNIGEAPSSACRGDVAANEGAYRWIRNGGVEPEAIACGGDKRCAQLAGESEELLAVEDTTTVSYGHEGSRELGDVGGKERSKKRGFMVHSVILLEERSGTTVGLIEQTRWCREKGSRGKRHKRKERAYEDKESFKWERASRRVTARLGEVMGRVISVCDREADVYEYLGYKTRCDERYVVRSSWDRRVKGEWRRLNEELANAPKLGEETVKVEQRGGRRARTAQLELRACRVRLRACRVRLRAPKRLGGAGEIEVNAVLAQEYEVPEGENGLCWLLLSSESIESLSAVRRVLRIYRMRWRVEEFHKAWKSGAGVEQRRMRGADNLERIAVVLAFVAVRLLQLREVFVPPAWMHAEGVVEANEKRAKSPCTEILSESEWKTLWMAQERTRPPSEAPTLGWAYESLGKLGGWMRRQRASAWGMSSVLSWR